LFKIIFTFLICRISDKREKHPAEDKMPGVDD